VLALARRRVNVLWALLRDNRATSQRPPGHTNPSNPALPPDKILTGQLRGLTNTGKQFHVRQMSI
jgi:hypothetical protein